jgi:Concanavalin A-like lectin/glucanases superfamily
VAAPIAAYSCDAGAGTTIPDESGNGRTLTIATGAYTQAGKNGLAAFGNTGGTASTGASGTVAAVSGTACSIMGWVNPSTLAASGVHLAFGAMQAGGNTDFGIYTQRGDFSTANVLQGDARIGGGLIAANGAALTAGTWAHVALTFDGTTLKLFKDGVQVASTTNAGSLANTGTLYLAGHASAGTGRVTVDDVRYFSTDESANIASWMNTPVGDPGGFLPFL